MAQVDKINLSNRVPAEYNRQYLFDALTAIQMEINRGADGYLFPGVTVTANYTVTLNNSFVLADATSGSITITLPPARECEQKLITIKRKSAGANTVTVDGNGAETIDGALTNVLATQYAAIELRSQDGAWWIV